MKNKNMKKTNSINNLKQRLKLCLILLISILTLGATDAQAQCPKLTVSPDVTICSGSSTVLTASGATVYNWGPARGLSSTTRKSVTANPTVTTTYTVTGRSGFGCISRKTIKVTVKERPNLSVVGERTICSGTSTTLTASGASTYIWGPAAGLNVTTGFAVIASPPTTTTYTVIGTNLEGCTRSQLVRIRVTATPEITVNGVQTVCKGNSTTLTASGASSYVWSPATGLNSTTGATVISTPSVTTTYTISGTTPTGCVSKTTVKVTVSNGLSVTITGNTSICSGDATELTAVGAKTYVWAASKAITSVSGATILAAPTETTTFSVVGTDASGCSETATIKVNVNAKPVITVSGNNANCSGSPVTLTATGAAKYVWSPASGLNATTGATVISTTTVATTYTVTGTSDAGCIGLATVTVNPSAKPIITVNGITTICNGKSTQLTAAGAASYSWIPSAGLSASTGATITASPTVTTTYTVTGTSLSGCIGTAVVTVSVNSSATSPIVITGNTTICQGATTNLTASGAANYVWSTAVGILNTAASLITTPTVTTTYTLSGTDSTGCNTTSIVTVNVNPNPIINIIGNRTICVGSSTTLTALGATTYNWSLAEGLSTTTGATVVATPTLTTTYTVTGTSLTGCIGTNTVTITVENADSTIHIIGNTTLCLGQTTNLTASGATNFVWSTLTGVLDTLASLIVTPTVTTTYTVSGTNAAGCASSSIIKVIVNALPKIDIIGNTTICAGSSTILTASGASSYTWTPSSSINTITEAIASLTPSVSTTYTVTGVNSFGCVGTTVVNTLLAPLPKIDITIPKTICYGTVAELIASGANTYSWTPAEGLSSTTGAIASLIPRIPTTYTVSGISLDGCIGLNTFTTTVNPKPIIDIIASATTICQGEKTEITASGAATLVWDETTSTQNSASKSATLVATPTVTTTYSLSITDANGCISTDSIKILVNKLPKIDISGFTTICPGASTTLTASGAPNFTWMPADGISALTGAIATLSPSVTTTYTLLATSLEGCISKLVKTIDIAPKPNVSVIAPKTICAGETAQLIATGAAMYQWIGADGLSATTGNLVNLVSTATTVASSITYTVIGTVAKGCVDTQTVTIQTLALPKISLSGITTICAGTTVDLTASGAPKFTWDALKLKLDANTGNSIQVSPIESTTFTVSGTNQFGCIGIDTISISVIPLPIISTSNNLTICGGTSVTLSASGASNYLWNGQGLSSTIGSTTSAAPLITTTYTVSGTVTGDNGCKGNTSSTIKVTIDCAKAKSLTLSTTSSFEIQLGGQIAPNPTSGLVHISPLTGNDKTIIIITDALGRLITEMKANDNNSPIDVNLSNENDGIYFVKLINGVNVQYNKIIKQ